MPCYTPLQAYPMLNTNENGKKPLSFTLGPGYSEESITIPCGNCIGCRLEKSRQWALRCTHEAQMFEENCWLTLTYSQENMPLHGNLVLEDFQKFMKRYRFQFEPRKIRFFMCGEYGENLEYSRNGKFGHPHYHVCIFNHQFHDRIHETTTDRGDKLYSSPTLSKLWPHGRARVSDLTFETAAYTARYVLKKASGKTAKSHYEIIYNDTGEIFNMKPEFTTMSRRPGIGKTWYDKFHTDLVQDTISSRGIAMQPPKYYDTQLELTFPDQYTKLKEKRKENALKHQTPDMYDRLKDGLKIKTKKIKNQLSRTL